MLGRGTNLVVCFPRALIVVKICPFAEILRATIGGTRGNDALDDFVRLPLILFALFVEVDRFSIFSGESWCL